MATPTMFTGLSSIAYQLCRTFAKQSHTDFTPVTAYPFACIIMSVTFMEAYFNEVIEIRVAQKRLTPERAEYLKRASLKRKLDGLVHELARNKWDKGRHPYQSFHQLLELRDELVHYKPEFQEVSRFTFPRRGIELIATKFRHKYFGRADWPILVLTPAVAEWACKTAQTIVVEFHCLTGTDDPWKQGLPDYSDKWWNA